MSAPMAARKGAADRNKQCEQWLRRQRAAWRRCNIRKGQVLDVKRYDRVLTGRVLRVCHDKAMAMIHYMGWSNEYDEAYPVDGMRLVRTAGRDESSDADGGSGSGGGCSHQGIRSNDQVLVSWGAQSEPYHALVLWTAGKVDAAQVQFQDEDSGTWTKWVTGVEVAEATE